MEKLKQFVHGRNLRSKIFAADVTTPGIGGVTQGGVLIKLKYEMELPTVRMI
jgi:hypothetical protein